MFRNTLTIACGMESPHRKCTVILKIACGMESPHRKCTVIQLPVVWNPPTVNVQ